MAYQIPAIPDISQNNIVDALQAIKEIIEVREGRRGPDPDNDAFMSINLMVDQAIACASVAPADGVSGWFDDGANFRVTVTNGIITGIAASTAGGYEVS